MPTIKDNRVAVQGFSEDSNSVFQLKWNNNKLELVGGANPKSVRLLVFFDPEQAPEKVLFVLPVIADSFDLDDKGGGRFELEGKLRSFLPELEHHGWAKLRMDVVASLDPNALLKFRTLELGSPSANELECTASALKAAELKKAHNFFLDKPRYAEAGLIALERDTAAAKLNWNYIVRFLSPTIKKETDHATLVIERTAEFPIKGKQKFPCFGLTVDGEEFAARPSGAFKIHHMTFRQRLPWDWTFDGGAGTGNWLVATDFPQSAVFSNWKTKILDPVTTAVNLVDAGRPLTTLPDLRMELIPNVDNPPAWDAWFTFVDRVNKDELKEEDYRPGFVQSKPKEESPNFVTIVPRRVTPREDEPRTAATFPAIKNHNGDPLLAAFKCQPLEFKSEKNYDGDTGQGIAFWLNETKPLVQVDTPSPQLVRMGAFDLQFLPMASKTGDVQELPSLEFSPASNAYEAWWETEKGNSFKATSLRLRRAKVVLGVSAIAPGGEDDVPGEEYAEDLTVDPEGRVDVALFGQRSRPLVFPLDKAIDEPWLPRYRLEMAETIEDQETQTIQFNLFELRAADKSNASSLRALIIDPQPWLVALIDSPPLSSLDPDALNEVANWTNRVESGAGWQVQAQVRGFDLVMPPQAIGEAMHRRLEDKDIVPGQAIDFRFTPPARLTLQQTAVLRRFTEPGWNLRRVTEAQFGVGLTEAKFELLYGISGTLRARNLRLSEIGARLGQYPGVQSKILPWISNPKQAELYEKTRRVWLGLLNGLRSRLAVLEPWSPLQDAFLVTQDDGLKFELRESASLQYPVRGQGESSTPASLPPYFQPDGLKGGWSWGFESRNVLNAVTREPKSFGGTLTDFYLSSLGGWGQQRAVFDRGLSTIISRVDMGRASTIVIERIGRISVFWNRAKHVIVYERTVAASRQFYQEQHPLVGNPVLRKVDEYIEILEPERAFPEGNAPAATRGFVTACRFADGQPPRIRVNSRWGEDIGQTGWKIPLWIRGAQPADVYPKPTIFMVGAGAVGERVPVALDDPDKLYFYTSTDPSLGADTNGWPAVEAVDFRAVDPVWIDPPKQKPEDATTDPASFNVDDKSIREGLGPFTLRLQAAPAAVNYVEGRADKAIRAIPTNITVMRGAVMEKFIVSKPEEIDVRELRTHVENSFSAFVNANPIKDYAGALTAFDKAFEDATNAYVRTIGVVEKGQNVCQSVQRRVTSQFQQFANEAKLEILSALHLFEHQFREQIKGAFPVADLNELKEKLRDALAELANDAGGARGQIRNIRGLPGEALAKLDLICDDLRTLNVKVGQAFARATATIAKLNDWKPPNPPTDLETARAALKQLLTDIAIADFLNRSGFDYRIAEIARTWLGAMPDQGRLLLDGARRQCQPALDETLQKLATTARDDVIAKLKEISDIAFEELIKVIARPDEEWRQVFEPDSEEPWPVENALDQLVTQLNKAINDLDTIDQNLILRKFDDITAAYYAGLNDQIDALIAQTGASDAAGALAKNICEHILASAADLKKYLDLVLNNQQLKNLEELLKAGLNPNEFLQKVDQVLTQMLDDVGGLLTRARVHLPELPTVEPRTLTDDVLRLFRSFGEAPDLPQLHFQTPRLGYYFLEGFDKDQLPRLLPHLNLSPVSAAANKLAHDVLNSVNLSVPVDRLLDRLVPADFRNFDLAKAMPRMAGLDLSHLFRAIRMPSMANEGVRVTQGIDEATRSGWLESDVDVSYQESLPVFDLAGVRLMLLRARFKATIRLDVVLGQQPRQRTFGSIRGDWSLTAGGFDLVELNDCTLEFDEGGHIRFHVTPAKVRLKPPLDFLSDLLAPFGGSDNGFHVSISPAGVQTTLYLPVPNIQAGSFGVSNLVLGFLFGLDIVPEFRIRTSLMIGRPTRPFTLTIFILGGAGYFSFSLTYVPRTGELIMEASIAIFASASLAISLGPISGGIYAYFGIAIDYLTSNKGASNLTVTLKIMFVGEVTLLGFISVGLTLGLDASYDSQKNLTGRGYVSLHIKIGWFIDISVNADISYTFGKGTSTSSSAQIQTAADNYVDMF